jgi:hypothetical protein
LFIFYYFNYENKSRGISKNINITIISKYSLVNIYITIKIYIFDGKNHYFCGHFGEGT